MFKRFSVLLIGSLLAGCFTSAPQQTQLSDPLAEQQTTEVLSERLSPDQAASEAVSPAEAEHISAVVEPLPVVEKAAPLLPYFGDFPLTTHPRIEQLLVRYQGRGRKTFSTWLKRAGRFIPAIQEIFAEEGVPLDLAYLALVESGFNTRAYSWAHAAGPWQFIESTGKIYDLHNDWWRDERCDLEKSTRAAAKHLSYLHQRFDGDWYLAVAAYNAGGGKVRRAVKASDSRDFWVLADAKVLSEETRYYVPKLLAVLTIVKDLESYGFAELDFAEPLAYETVTVATTTDLEIIADLCDVSYDEIKALNPNLKRWSTPPQLSDYAVHVPFGTAEKFQLNYANLPEEQRASYQRHQIVSGDSLLALANKYQIQVADIIALNKIENPRALQLGDDLILPLREGYTALPVESLADKYVRTRRRSYQVRKGDSLWSIARRFDVSEKQLRVWNKLGWSNTIQPGHLLAVSARGKARAQAVQHRGKTYQVKPGDSISTIAHKYNLSQQQLRHWNNLGKSNFIKVGQRLALSSGKAKSPVALARSVAENPPAAGATYKVASGDSLWVIARRFNLSSGQLRDWNQLGKNEFIQPGQLLALSAAGLPVAAVSNAPAADATKYAGQTYRVRAGDSLWSIATRYNLHGSDLRSWNQLGESDILQPGQQLALSAVRPAPVAVVETEAGTSRKLLYKVLPGDSLSGIGQQFGVKTEMIRAWNDLSSSHTLQPGQMLTLLVAVSQQG